MHPNTWDKSSGSVNTRITYILHILILQRVFECTQSLCLRNSCFYALKDWIDVQNSYIAFEKKDKKKFISRLLVEIGCKGKSVLGWKLPYYLCNLFWLIFYVLCNSRYWKTVIERYLAFCWENLFSILLAFCSKNASTEWPCRFVDQFSKLRCLKRKVELENVNEWYMNFWWPSLLYVKNFWKKISFVILMILNYD